MSSRSSGTKLLRKPWASSPTQTPSSSKSAVRATAPSSGTKLPCRPDSEILILREACGFWTDATIAAVAYARGRTGTSSDQLNKMFDISDDFEDLEWPKLALETIAAPSAHIQPDVKEPEPAVHAPQSTTLASQASVERVDTPNDQSTDPVDIEEDGAAAINLDALFD
jgi:hypothetical protein